MKSIKLAFLSGFLSWLLSFGVSFIIFPLRESNYYLFESIMSAVIVLAAVIFACIYFKKTGSNRLREGILLGVLWLLINLVIDFALFLPKSPMQMSFSLYISQIGVKYFSIPIITTGFGYLQK